MIITEKLTSDLITVVVDGATSESISVVDQTTHIDIVVSVVGEKGDKGDAGLTEEEVLTLVRNEIDVKFTDVFNNPL